MPTSHTASIPSTDELSPALHALLAFREERRAAREPVPDFLEFEDRIHRLVAAAECEVIAEELARLDEDVPEIVVDDVAHQKAVRCEGVYVTAAGEIRVERSLYRASRDEESVSPMELRAGIVEGRFTPRAAELSAFAVAHLTPAEAEEFFRRIGGMRPSKSTLDRLPKALSERWEKDRESFEAVLIEQTPIPAEAVTVAVSLDGVMVPLKDGRRAEKRAESRAAGRQMKGPAGYGEASVATLSQYDAEGERLSTVRFARMPEAKKVTLKAQLKCALAAILARRPELRLVKVADGAKDNWEFLSKELPPGEEIVDFYHAAEHLKTALDTAYGENSPKSGAEFDKLRHLLRNDPDGVGKVIRALDHQRKQHPKRKNLAREVEYFRNNRGRMKYAQMKAARLPIGSGVVEGACKTLATQRLKRSGMRWRHLGGQAILTLRSLVQSDWWDCGWYMLVDTYKATVRLPENVLPMRRRKDAA